MASLNEVLKDQSMTRRRYDGCKTGDDLRLTTGPGRYQLDVPTGGCDACFVPQPTIRQQKWGATLNDTYTKTDVESDLLNINRPTTRTVCNQYEPTKNDVNRTAVQSVKSVAKECSFPQTHTRLVDPPCNNRAVGYNRFEWLCDNPQDTVMIPFDNLVTTRLQKRDEHRPCIPKPITATGLPPEARDDGTMFDAADSTRMGDLLGRVAPGLQTYPERAKTDGAWNVGGYDADSIPSGPFA